MTEGHAGRIPGMAALVLFFALLSAVASAAAVQNAGNTRFPKTGSEGPLVILGASYARGWEIETLAGHRVINRGMGGEQTQQLLDRFDRDVIRHKPAAVLIWGFINDLFQAPREQILSRRIEARNNIDRMVKKARAAGIRPILATEVTIVAPEGLLNTLQAWVGKLRGKQSYQDYINEHVQNNNEWLRTYAADQKVPILDFEKALAASGGIRDRRYASEDGSHLNAQAYRALTDYASRYFAYSGRL